MYTIDLKTGLYISNFKMSNKELDTIEHAVIKKESLKGDVRNPNPT